MVAVSRSFGSLWRRRGKQGLWIYDVKQKSCRQLGSAVVLGIVDPVWSPDGSLIYVSIPRPTDGAAPPADVSTKNPVMLFGGFEDKANADQPRPALPEPVIALAAVDTRTEQARTLVPADAEPHPLAMRLSPSGRWASYLTHHQQQGISGRYTKSLAIVPAAGGVPRLLADGLPELWGSGSTELVYSWHPTRDLLAYWKDDGVWLVEFSDGGPSAPRRLAPELGSLDSTIYWFTRDGRALVVGIEPEHKSLHGRPNSGSRGLAVAPLEGGPAVRLPLDKRWELIEVVKANASTVWQPDPRAIIVQARERATAKRALLRFDLHSGEQRVLWQSHSSVGLSGSQLLTALPDHRSLIGLYEDLRTSPGLYDFSSDFSHKRRIVSIDVRLDQAGVGPAEVFDTVAPMHDGSLELLSTTVLLPQGARRGDRLPAVVMMYPETNTSSLVEEFGGGTANTTPNLLYTSSGYAVILAQVKTGPGGRANDVIKNMTDSLLPQVYRAAELGYVDVRRLALSGQSYGGYATAAIISQTNLFRAAIAINGLFDVGGLYARMETDGSAINMQWAEVTQGGMGTHPWANILRYIENSPYYRADKIVTPLLLVAGKMDGRVPSEESMKLYAALRRLERPVQLALYPDEGHSILYWKQASAADSAARMLQFLEKYLGGSNREVRH